jgi:hypothetical protein
MIYTLEEIKELVAPLAKNYKCFLQRMVFKLKLENFDLSTISNCTELTLKEIKEILD